MWFKFRVDRIKIVHSPSERAVATFPVFGRQPARPPRLGWPSREGLPGLQGLRQHRRARESDKESLENGFMDRIGRAIENFRPRLASIAEHEGGPVRHFTIET